MTTFVCQSCHRRVTTSGVIQRRKCDDCRSPKAVRKERDDWDLSPLNVAVSRNYELCLKRGTHKPGPELTRSRYFSGMELRMQVCPVCEVPFPGHGAVFSLTGSLRYNEEDAA